jgi:DNA-binding response OmpR family regulator
MAAIVAQDGYQALQAGTGSEALDIAEHTPVDLVLTDVVMPGMSGPELVTALRERGLVKRFLMVSGYAGDALDKIHGLFDRTPLLLKPFTPGQLLSKVHELLDSSNPKRAADWDESAIGDVFSVRRRPRTATEVAAVCRMPV